MSLGIPTIMSPVGVNSEIITNGENGFLADGTADWVEKISLLIENENLRKVLGEKGKETVQERFSVHAQKGRYLKFFDDLCKV